MFLSIFRFEIAYHLRRPLFYLVSFFFGMLAFGAIVSDTVQIGGALGNINRNAPLVILRMLAVFTPIGTFVITAFVASAALRDFELGTHPLFFSKPIKKFDYLIGRFAGALVVSCLVFLGPALGIFLGSVLGGTFGWIDPARLGPLSIEPFLTAFGIFIVPNMLFIGATFFTVASLTRSWFYTYIAVVGFFVGLFLSNRLVADLENLTLGSLINPFGLGAMNQQTRYWTVAESNTRLPELSGLLLQNRVLWVVVGLVILAIGYSLFSYSRAISLKRSDKKRREQEKAPEPTVAQAPTLPAMRPSFGSATYRQQLWRSTRYEFVEVFRSIPFLVIVVFGLFNLIASSSLGGRIFGTTVYPVTHMMITNIQQSFSFLLVIIITFYAGELVWRERGQKLKDVFDALPVPNSVFLISKTAALLMIVLAFLTVGVLASIGVQIYNSYSHFELATYAKGILVSGYPFLLIAVLAVFLQVIANNKFLGFLLMIGYMLLGIIFNALDMSHNIYNYAASPGSPYSDMNGYGHFVGPQVWFNLYWTFAALALSALAALFWVRGRESAPRFRLQLARRRLHGATAILLSVGLVGFVALGAWIFYNTNVLNRYLSPDEQQDSQADYEKKYSQYLDLPMPRITSVSVDVDIFPYERRVEARGTYSMINKTDQVIDQLHFNRSPTVTYNSFDLPAHTVELADDDLGYYIYRLDQPLQPGEPLELNFDVTVDPQGFVNSGSDTSLVYNGTFFNNRTYFPVMGYAAQRQLLDRNERRKRDLEPVDRMPKVDDLEARQHTFLGRDADWIDFETTVSTAADQIAIAPGYLQKEWTEGDRRYFHYEMDSPILHFYSFLSARYEVLRDSWSGPDGDVAIEIYYHPGHEYNLQRMVESTKDSLDYFSKNFGPYQHRQFRILEFPRYQSFAQAFPNTIPFSESIGFIARLDDDPDAIDYPYYVTSHEMAHQWWAHQVVGGNVQGSTMLSETMSQYSALMVMKQEYGEKKMRDFLEYELDNYLRNRGSELIEELPLMLVENQQYIHYRKGSVIMYALQDLIGEDNLNTAIRAYVDDVAFQQPPFTHTPEFMAYVRAATPPQYAETVEDMFTRITLFDHEVKQATYTEQADGTYLVRMETASTKLYADGQGEEEETAIDDWVDIGIFGESKTDGKSEETVLFMEKRHIQEADQVFEVVVADKPVRAGIDPYHLMVDRNGDNNTKRVKAESEAARP